MEIIIQSLGFTAGDGLESYVREKLDKFDKEARIVRANVVLFIGSDSNPTKYYCEIRLEVPGNDHFVKKSSDSFETAIVDAVHTLQQAMRKAKEKQLDRNHDSLS
jgi:putative sigma-54 modulation protein